MLPSWASQSVTIIQPGTKTVRGATVPDWDNPIKTTTVGKCSIQPASTSLSEDGRILGVTDGMTAYLPEGTEVNAIDHVVYDGNTYTINGEPRVWVSPTGHNNHIQLNLVRYEG